MSFVYAYLGVGLVLGTVLGAYLAGRYRARVLLPAVAMHGKGQVAVARDALALASIFVAVVLAWLPLLLAYGVFKGRGLIGGPRSRENNPTPTL